MSKLFPTKQEWVDIKDGDIYGITKVKIATSTSDHVVLPNVADAALLQNDANTANPTFYLTQGKDTFNIDGATVGSTQVIVSKHRGRINFQSEDA